MKEIGYIVSLEYMALPVDITSVNTIICLSKYKVFVSMKHIVYLTMILFDYASIKLNRLLN